MSVTHAMTSGYVDTSSDGNPISQTRSPTGKETALKENPWSSWSVRPTASFTPPWHGGNEGFVTIATVNHTAAITHTVATPTSVLLDTATRALSWRAPGRATSLHLPAAVQSLGERDLVGILEVPADRETAREPRDGDAERL